MLTVHFVKIAASAKTVGKLSFTKSNRRVISLILTIDPAVNLTKKYVFNAFGVLISQNTAIMISIDI